MPNTTIRLDVRNVLQPDLYLRILEESGGQSKLSPDGYVDGTPELIVEIAASSASFDLHKKLKVYEKFAVREYLVSCVWDDTVSWFTNRDGQFQALALGADRIYRSEVFPGLWLDPEAMIAGRGSRVLEVLQQGLASPEHARFRTRLAEKAATPRPAKKSRGGRKGK